MRIGVSTAAYYGRMETEDAAARLAQLGVQCCEVFLETYSEYNKSFGRLVKERLGKTQAVSVHSKTQHFESDFFGLSKRQREDAFALYDHFLDAGQALGAQYYVYHGPANPRGNAPDFTRWQEGMQRALAMGSAKGIRLCWETVSWCQLNSPDRVSIFRRLWPQLGFVLDIKQVYELGQNVYDYIDAMGDALCHVHVLDYDASGRYVLPGKGIFDFGKLAARLRKADYRGNIILEPYANVVQSDAALIESVNWLRDAFAVE